MKLGSGTAPSNSSFEIGFDEAGFRVVSGLKIGRAKSDLKIRQLIFNCRNSVSEIRQSIFNCRKSVSEIRQLIFRKQLIAGFQKMHY